MGFSVFGFRAFLVSLACYLAPIALSASKVSSPWGSRLGSAASATLVVMVI